MILSENWSTVTIVSFKDGDNSEGDKSLKLKVAITIIKNKNKSGICPPLLKPGINIPVRP